MASEKINKLCFFTDEKAKNFHPLTLTRPVDDLRVGAYTIREKWLRSFGIHRYSRLLPNYMKEVFQQGEVDRDDVILWVNPRFLPSQILMDALEVLKENQCIIFDGSCAAAKVTADKSAEMFQKEKFSADGLDEIVVKDLIHLEHLWDLLMLNAYEIEKDVTLSGLKSVAELGHEFEATITHPENTFIAEEVELEPGVTLIANKGPIVLMKGACIESGSILKGPVVIGKGSTVKMGARISDGTTLGPVCKVGGEVMNCIFHSYSNKAHDGFTGNSLFGQWVNLGADTNTSNLKNNYSTVRITDWNTKQETETEQQFLGTIMADHSKTAINTMLNTGTVCGVSSNIFMSGFPPKYIPSFSWVGSEEYGVYKFDKAIEAMHSMMKRRDIPLSDGYKNMMEYIAEKDSK
ncbi:putative sugar nucleotidyl transferase [Gracilimonas sp.]|uniref:putative sugar nucleotidyl transferase n=1 Tax=Gracilimonas sp. TaxID=1974203 RepID=UPI0028723B9C|nr:putative sugar nucleotidyl transferase [Gracilimonas sp.]